MTDWLPRTFVGDDGSAVELLYLVAGVAAPGCLVLVAARITAAAPAPVVPRAELDRLADDGCPYVD